MREYQREFIEFALGVGALQFGSFTLKSGRQSPYFFNSGLFDSGRRLERLGAFYAAAIVDAGIEVDTLYGPAYKGIPLVAAVAIAFAREHGRDLPYAFNRKEAKDHGEGGIIVGAALTGRVVIVDDVISAGTSTRESDAIIRAAGAEPRAVAIALDRMERGQGPRSAIDEVRAELGIEVASIITLEHLVGYLRERGDRSEDLERVETYRARYGVADAAEL